MADLRIVDAPEIPAEDITGEEKLPTGGNGNYSITLDSVADYTKTKKDLVDTTTVDGKVGGVRQELNTHIEDLLNPHQVTKDQIGLGNVDNTADADKPVSNSAQAAIISAVSPKADKTYVDGQLALKANKADVYTKSETYTKQESSALVNSSISTALIPINTSLDLAKRGVVNRYDSSLTYNSGERVVLANGDIVKSTIDGNANNPNVDMTSWVKTNSTSSISDESGKTQQQINNGLNSIVELLVVPKLVDGSRFTTKSYHAPNYVYAKPFSGGSTYVYNSSMPKTNHNGGTVIASGEVFPEDWTVREDVEAWFAAPNSGNGCWVVVNTDNQIDVTIFGAMPNFNLGVDNSIAINKALSINNNIYIPSGNYIAHRPILTNKAFPIISGAGGESTLITIENTHWQGVTFNGKNHNAAIVVTSGVQDTWIEGATLKDFSLLGNSYTADGKIGIDFDNVCLKVNVNNVNISAFDKGIHTYKSWVHSYNNVTVTDCITNSMHFDTFANGYSLTGVCLYGKSVKTLCHLKFENACYGNSFNGGAIEHCWIGVSTRNNAQVNITGVDWEVIDQLFMENVDCVGLPSKIDSCSIMGNPSQSGFGVSNGQLVLENNKIFNPLGSKNIDASIYFVGGTGGVVANNNEYGAHTTLIGGTGKVTGNDVGRFDFSKSRRITDGKILDAYSETYQAFFSFYTNDLDVYQSVSGTVLKTQVGNTYKARIDTLLTKAVTTSGDYFTFQFSELSNVQGVVGAFAFSPSNNLLGTDCITGQVICNSGTCYLMKSAGGLLTKAALSTATDTNLFSLSLSYTDSI